MIEGPLPQLNAANVIKLTLLHPVQSIPVRSWIFEDEQLVRIGRSTDNHVVLYSAVVSRRHVELRRNGSHWEVINLGTNGTYLDGHPIAQAPAADGQIIHLARSGPKIQIHLGKNEVKPQVARTLAKPREAAAIGDSESNVQISTLPVQSQSERVLPPDIDELTESEWRRNGH